MSAIVELVPGNTFMRMHSALRWTLGVMGFALLAVSPYLWQINLNFLWLMIPILAAWALLLVIEYLRWAETLGSKSNPHFDNLNMKGQAENDRKSN